MWRSGVYHINSNHIIISSNSISASQSENEIINKEITNFYENVINFLVDFILIPTEFLFRKLSIGSSK